MNTVLWRPNGGGSQYAQGWGLSIVVHGFAIGVTIALLSDLHLATRPDPFRWQVSVVGTTHHLVLIMSVIRVFLAASAMVVVGESIGAQAPSVCPN